MKLVLSILFLLFNIVVHSQSDISFYVSPSGNDTWAGTEKKPFKTIEKAQLAVRKTLVSSNNNVTVFLREGEYLMNKTLIFTANDGGNWESIVKYKAYPGERPVLTGGKKIVDWEPYKDGIYKTMVTGTGFRQLYVNNMRATRARQPNPGDYYRLTGWDLKSRNLIVDAKYIQQWNNFHEVEAVIQMAFTDNYVHLKSFEKFSGGVRLAYVSIKDSEADILFPRQFPQKQNNAAFHLENALEFLDQPGEWYLNANTRELFYKPNPEQDINQLEIIAPVTETLVSIEGSLDHPVKNLSFEGLIFEHANWNLPSKNGFINGTAGMYNLSADLNNNQFVRRPGAAIRIKNAHLISFEGNLFQHMGSTAIDLISGTNECRIVGNVIRSISGNGVMIGTFTSEPDGEFHIPYNPTDKREICTKDEISNNLIIAVARDYYGTCPIAAGYPSHLKITHNEIKDAPYIGIFLGYGWTSEPNAMQFNLIGYNDISNVMNLLCDGGAIYTLSRQPGTKIIENYIHEVKRSKWAGPWSIASIYLDEQSGGTDELPMVVERNSLPRTDKDVFHWHFHKEGIILLKNNSIYRIEEVIENAGIEENYKTVIQNLAQ